MTIWTLVVDNDNITTSVHTTELEAYEALQKNFADDLKVDLTQEDGINTLIEEVVNQGIVFYLERHDLGIHPALPTPKAI